MSSPLTHDQVVTGLCIICESLDRFGQVHLDDMAEFMLPVGIDKEQTLQLLEAMERCGAAVRERHGGRLWWAGNVLDAVASRPRARRVWF